MDLRTYQRLRAQARRLGNAAEADDLVQDALLAGLQAGRADLPWLSGTLRHLAAMHVRTAVHRRRRESEVASGIELVASPPEPRAPKPTWLRDWPPSLRRVAVLALHGLDEAEIRWILALSGTAFRQRLSRIRKRLETLQPGQRAESIALAYVRDPARSADLQFGLVRRALKASLGGSPGMATHDADGHRLVIRSPGHNVRPRGNP